MKIQEISARILLGNYWVVCKGLQLLYVRFYLTEGARALHVVVRRLGQLLI